MKLPLASAFRATRRLLSRAAIGAWLAVALPAALANGNGAANGSSRVASEYDLKAVFLLNFGRFIEWPASAFAKPNAPFVIGILGESEILAPLLGAAEGETVGDRPLVVRHLRSAAEASTCQIIFVPRKAQAEAPRLLRNLLAQPILIVGETDRFCHQGGMINFILQGDGVRFELNRRALESARLRPGSRLLQLARLVEDAPGARQP